MDSVSSTESSSGEIDMSSENDVDSCKKEEKTEEEGDDKLEDKVKKDQEIFVIQDTSFTIQIALPGSEPFDLTVSVVEMKMCESDFLFCVH